MNTPESGSRTPGRVVVGVDGSPSAGRALRWAAREATARGVPLHLVHGADISYGDYIIGEAVRLITDAARTVLTEAADEVRGELPDLPVTTRLCHAPGAVAVLQDSGPDDLAVVGSRGRGGFTGLLLGSVSLRVAARAACPVVVVRGGSEERIPAGDVVVGLRDERDLPAARFAAREAGLRQAPLRVVRTWRLLDQAGLAIPMFDEVAEARDAQAGVFTEVVAGLRQEFPGVAIGDEFVVGPSPAGTLVEESAGARLLVVGARAPRLGRVVHAVLHHAVCPTAVVHQPPV